MNEQIKAGDVVKLKSGSQPMTVEFTSDRVAHVVWMTSRGERMMATLALAALEIVE